MPATDANCIFCKIVKKEIPAEILWEDAHYMCFLDANPIVVGHSLVIPKAHSRDILDATPNDREGLLNAIAKVAPGILKGVGAESFNIGINTGKPAGQVVFHTHIHIIPRLEKDHLKSWGAAEKNAKDLHLVREKIKRFL